MSTALITGATGFIGTNLSKSLLDKGYTIIAIDNFSSSESWKAKLFKDNPNYEFLEFDVTKNIQNFIKTNSKTLKTKDKIDQIYNLACPASPPRYQALPLETIDVCTNGMINMLKVAEEYGATILHTSTSEVYGDPEVHPQTEDYRGNVNIVGIRSCYDEGKRISETICFEYQKEKKVDTKIVRLFNTYGPYMDPDDGRVITNFIKQALEGQDITIYGDGSQTRSFQFIDDLIEAFEKVTTVKDFHGPVNLGNPVEFTIKELAELVIKLTKSKSTVVYHDLPMDDPKKRKPDISLAKEMLGWEPQVKLEEGLRKTIQYYKDYFKGYFAE